MACSTLIDRYLPANLPKKAGRSTIQRAAARGITLEPQGPKRCRVSTREGSDDRRLVESLAQEGRFRCLWQP